MDKDSDVTRSFLAAVQKQYKEYDKLSSLQKSAFDSLVLDNAHLIGSENDVARVLELVNDQLEDRVASDAMIAQQQAMRQAAEETAASFSGFMGSLNDINSAYSTLREGEELSTEALYKLAAAYPEISRYICLLYTSRCV